MPLPEWMRFNAEADARTAEMHRFNTDPANRTRHAPCPARARIAHSWALDTFAWATVFVGIAVVPLLIVATFTTSQWVLVPIALVGGGLGGYVASWTEPSNIRRRQRAKRLGSS